jgi:hypothetical protein
VLKRLDLKEAPPLAKIFDFTITRKVSAELQAKGWKTLSPGGEFEARNPKLETRLNKEARISQTISIRT